LELSVREGYLEIASGADVGLGESSEHALQLVEQIVREATCLVIALIHRVRS
jgi:hypothetical protein